MTRIEFVEASRLHELRWCYPETYEYGFSDRYRVVSIGVGPWRCGCGFECRDAGRMWDHTQECTAIAAGEE